MKLTNCITWPSLGWAAPLKVRLKQISPEQLRLLRRQCNRMHVAPSIRCVDQVLTGTRTSICLCCTIEMNLKYVQSGWIIMFSSINLSLWFLGRDVVFIRSLFRFFFFFYKKEQSWSVLLQKGARHLCRWYFIPYYFGGGSEAACIQLQAGRWIMLSPPLQNHFPCSVYNYRWANAHTHGLLWEN